MTEPAFRPLEHIIGKSTVRVEYTDITTLNVDAVVSSDDIDLSMGGGVSSALLRAAGESVWREAQAFVPVALGDVAVTGAGRLNAKRIIHAAVLDYNRRGLTNIDLIRKVTRKSLEVCDASGLRSIALPALATGVAGLSPERSAVAMMIEIAGYLNGSTEIKLVILALYPRADLPRHILPQFYARVADFLELTQRVESVTAALANLERVYGGLKMNEAADVAASSRENLRKRVFDWEVEMLTREPMGSGRAREWREYQREIAAELDSISSLGLGRDELEEIRRSRERPQSWERLEVEYIEYRSRALREMIAIRKRNITDLELEKARGNFSTQLNRQLEHEREELDRLTRELRDLK